jgi:response regulator RpfG family c-di-GMP phosphodiesterase
MSENHNSSRPSGDGLERDSAAGGGVNSLAGTRALILLEDSSISALLHQHLKTIGVECGEARCLAGASALLRRDEDSGQPADFLFADEKIAGMCGVSMCSALMLQLKNRPTVLLATKNHAGQCEAKIEGSCVDAVFDFRTSAAELGVMLKNLRN